MKENFIEKLHENGMLNLLLVSLISSDNLIDIDSCEKSLNEMNKFIEKTKEANIPDKEKYLDMMYKGVEIIERDLNIFKNENKQ